MKARRTASGTTSVLIEPCRKNLRSSSDQLGACARPGDAGFFSAAAASNAAQKSTTALRIAGYPPERKCPALILIDAVIENSPANLLFNKDNALGGLGFFLKPGFEKHADVIAFGNTNQFSNIRCTDEFSAQSATKGRSPGLHEPDKLSLCTRHAKILRFPFKCFVVIALIEQVQPPFGSR